MRLQKPYLLWTKRTRTENLKEKKDKTLKTKINIEKPRSPEAHGEGPHIYGVISEARHYFGKLVQTLPRKQKERSNNFTLKNQGPCAEEIVKKCHVLYLSSQVK